MGWVFGLEDAGEAVFRRRANAGLEPGWEKPVHDLFGGFAESARLAESTGRLWNGVDPN